MGFPEINASLNALAAVLLIVGYAAIRARRTKLHIACMTTALVVSAVFLASYLYFHIVIREGKATSFAAKWPLAPEWVKYLYFAILGSHTILAILATPLALTTAWLGWRNRLDRHVRLARWTLPIWLYVSITGVVVYWMLYRLYAAA